MEVRVIHVKDFLPLTTAYWNLRGKKQSIKELRRVQKDRNWKCHWPVQNMRRRRTQRQLIQQSLEQVQEGIDSKRGSKAWFTFKARRFTIVEKVWQLSMVLHFLFVPYNSINPEKDSERQQNMDLGSLAFWGLFCFGKGSIQLTKSGKNG